MAAKFDKNIDMAKILRVINPFFVMEVGDTFTFDKDSEMYVSEHDEEIHAAISSADDLTSSYKSTFKISPKWAEQLLEEGYIEEVDEEEKKSTTFRNVFDEIEDLLKKYQSELDNINETMANDPECLRVEKTTVLANLIKVLNHLKTLRK